MDISTQLDAYLDRQDESDFRDLIAELVITNPSSAELDAETLLVIYALAMNYLAAQGVDNDHIY